jgi:hypothetical protein
MRAQDCNDLAEFEPNESLAWVIGSRDYKECRLLGMKVGDLD